MVKKALIFFLITSSTIYSNIISDYFKSKQADYLESEQADYFESEQVSEDTMRKKLGEFMKLLKNDEDLLKKDKNSKTRWIDIFNDKVTLSPKLLQDQYNKLDDKKAFIKKLLEDYTPSGRQELINSMLEKASYKQLFLNLPEEKYAEIKDPLNPQYFGVVPTIDWLNIVNIPSFFQPTMKNVFTNRENFNDFNSFDQWGLWAEPFVLYTPFKRKEEPLQFNLSTIGITLGGAYTFTDHWTVGLGLGYFYSGIDWKTIPSSAHTHSLYGGPSLSYLSSKGYASCMILGAANFYQIEREIPSILKKTDIKEVDHSQISWDLMGRLEGALFYSLGKQFFLYPKLSLDYLMSFELSTTETLDEETFLTTEGINSSFLHGKAGITITREFLNPNIGFFIPSLSFGYVGYLPLSTSSYHYEIQECDHTFDSEISLKSWSQPYIGIGFAMLHKTAILFSLDAELTIGSPSPIYTGSLRVELSW